ncbi:hypothetical protein AaE_014875 [Aphanomyces astaci]|uniref:Uncharacterized protein n=1 Tax=Aphanomyces astaci TaxID=112090 RepID=A0A6A4Z4B0_APHAT|nr:hypothetical protein AaE_014875 [Aphanomyces astaci]
MSTSAAAVLFGFDRMMLKRRVNATMVKSVESLRPSTSPPYTTNASLVNFIRVCIENSQHEHHIPDTSSSIMFVKQCGMLCPPTPPTCHCKRLLDVGLVRFRVKNSRFTVISDMVAIASTALAECKNVHCQWFEMTGIYPLSLDDITSKILRDKPGAKPPRTKMQATVPVETRVIVLLRTQGIDIDVARVVCINESLIQAITQRTSAPKAMTLGFTAVAL